MAPRGTAAEMLILTGGKYPPPHDATSYLAFCAQADTLIDTFALPAVLSTTGTAEIALANRVSVNLLMRSIDYAAGKEPTGPELTTQNKADIVQLAMDTTEDGFTTLDMIDEDA